jgi:simple sugar transport system ATP-binding protein
LRRLDGRQARSVAIEELQRFGLAARDVRRPVATLSGGQRQAVAIAKAIHFGADVLILDEPTSALGVRQAGTVLQYISDARERGLGILFITHNVQHAFPLGDTFTVLTRGRVAGVFEKGELTIGGLATMMASGEDLEELEADGIGGGRPDAGPA